MTGHTSSIYSLAFSAESSLLVSGGADWTVRCWDVKGAGGLKGKARENGAASTEPGPRSEEESLETYVYFVYFTSDDTDWYMQHRPYIDVPNEEDPCY